MNKMHDMGNEIWNIFIPFWIYLDKKTLHILNIPSMGSQFVIKYILKQMQAYEQVYM